MNREDLITEYKSKTTWISKYKNVLGVVTENSSNHSAYFNMLSQVEVIFSGSSFSSMKKVLDKLKELPENEKNAPAIVALIKADNTEKSVTTEEFNEMKKQFSHYSDDGTVYTFSVNCNINQLWED